MHRSSVVDETNCVFGDDSCQLPGGLANEIEARDASRLDEGTDIAAEAIAQRFGRSAVDGKVQALIVAIEC